MSPTTTGTRSRPGLVSPTTTGTRSRPGLVSPTTTGTRSRPGLVSPTTTGTRSRPGLVSPTTTGTRSRVAGSFSPTVTATRSRAAGSLSPTVTATRSRAAGSLSPTVTATRSRVAGSLSPTVTATRSRVAGSSSPTVSETRTGTRTESSTLTSSISPSVMATTSPTPTQTISGTPTTTATIFTLRIPTQQNSNADTIIRGYISSYAASAGYSNAIVNSITWENGAYTVVGSVVNPVQFSSSFPLSVGYSNLLANLSPSTPTPSVASPISSLALPIGLAVGGTAIVAISIGGILYVVRQRRRKVVNIRSPVPETKISVPAKVAPMPADLYTDNMNMMSNEALPSYPILQSDPLGSFAAERDCPSRSRAPRGDTASMAFAPQPINRLKVGTIMPSAINNFKPDHDAIKRMSAQLVVSPSMRNLQQTVTKNPFQRPLADLRSAEGNPCWERSSQQGRLTYPTANADLPPLPPPPPPPMD